MHHWQVKIWLYRQHWHCPWDPQQSIRRGLYLQLQHPEGSCSWGEIAPLPGFSSHTLSESFQQLTDFLEHRHDASLRSAATYWGIQCAKEQRPQAEPDSLNQRYPLLQGDEQAILSYLEQYPGPLTLAKLKVARRALTEEVSLIAHINQAYPQLKLRLDANGHWNYQQAESFLAQINTANLAYLEQPCASLADCLKLAKADVPIALDESLQHQRIDAQTLANIQTLVLKPTLLGKNTDYYLQIAKTLNIPISISSSFESRLGLLQLKSLANQYGDLYPGLDTLRYFSHKQVTRLIYFRQFADNPLLY
ncbi:o-succinylbenzoate synthase [Celerinatantimonas diazotrophica]|uniref:o-succinylbenzoate synthase n=1 Tax=Celerinatantimonas diazotrophica TaxID=412034 RepID=A0A4R1J7W1_9GAMM|nr:o-succinylbenzoate synthase [Celerinatantimonas diazotrophica]TCK46635.1 O-succinylbenzoate synthase [Celerinatantimonas diazotrophica]CAG9295337.1 o-succinylbenzoate synthase [Celerinatantimonas diazotrophica]